MRLFGGLEMSRWLVRLRVSRAVFVVAVLSLSGGALVGATTAVAGPAVSTSSPITYDGWNTCAVEAFTGTGTVHFLVSENLSASGVLQRVVRTNIDGLNAIAMPSGKKYVVQDTFFEEFVFSGTTFEDTFDMTLHYVRLGEEGTLIPGDDFYYYMRAHITANATGTPVFRMDTQDMPCQ
jgi:hypothetical protein